MVVKIVEIMDKEFAEKFLNNCVANGTRIISVSVTVNPNHLMGNSVDEYIFFVTIEQRPQHKNDSVVSVAGSELPKMCVGHYMTMEE